MRKFSVKEQITQIFKSFTRKSVEIVYGKFVSPGILAILLLFIQFNLIISLRNKVIETEIFQKLSPIND